MDGERERERIIRRRILPGGDGAAGVCLKDEEKGLSRRPATRVRVPFRFESTIIFVIILFVFGSS